MRFPRAFVLILCGCFRGSKCSTMAANILFIRVTRSVLADEVVGGLNRMATSALLPNVL